MPNGHTLLTGELYQREKTEVGADLIERSWRLGFIARRYSAALKSGFGNYKREESEKPILRKSVHGLGSSKTPARRCLVKNRLNYLLQQAAGPLVPRGSAAVTVSVNVVQSMGLPVSEAWLVPAIAFAVTV